jgi:hypothetical protein
MNIFALAALAAGVLGVVYGLAVRVVAAAQKRCRCCCGGGCQKISSFHLYPLFLKSTALVLRTSCLHGALHIIKSRRLKNRKQFLFFLTPLAVSTFFYKVSVGGTAYITFGFEAKKAKTRVPLAKRCFFRAVGFFNKVSDAGATHNSSGFDIFL